MPKHRILTAGLQTVCTRRIGPRAFAAGGRRSWDRAAASTLLLARIRRALRDRALHPAGYRWAAAESAPYGPSSRRNGAHRAGRAAHDWRGVFDRRGAGGFVART